MATPIQKVLEDGRIEISGRTYDHRELIKAHKGAWNPQTKTWIVPAGTTIVFPALLTHPMDAITSSTPAPIRPYGRCCEKAVCHEEYWQGPTLYDCDIHGRRFPTKKGRYTGD